MLTIAVINLKGGTGKTTTSGFLLAGYAEMGLSVLGIDADAQRSFLEWSGLGELPPVVALPTKSLHRQFAGIVPDDKDVVIIDTPPIEEQAGIVVSALRVADRAVVPMAPTPGEYARLADIQATVQDAADLRPDGSMPAMDVLLTRTVANAASTRTYREIITEDGINVLPVEIPRRERFAQAMFAPIKHAQRTAYGDVCKYLLNSERV